MEISRVMIQHGVVMANDSGLVLYALQNGLRAEPFDRERVTVYLPIEITNPRAIKIAQMMDQATARLNE